MEGLRLKDVAEQVGIQPPSVFAHFEGREAIGDAIAQRILGRIGELLGSAVVGEGPPAERLRQGARLFAGHLMDHPAHTRLLLRDLTRTRTGSELEMWSPVVTEIENGIGALLAEGERSGDFRAIPARAFMAQLEGAILATIGWMGFQEDGQPASPLTREEIQAQAEELAMAIVARRP